VPGWAKSHYCGNMARWPSHIRSSPLKVRSGSSQGASKAGRRSGSVLEWDEDGDRVVVRKAGRYSSEDIHRALFSRTPKREPSQR
jgi:hypothetical protein